MNIKQQLLKRKETVEKESILSDEQQKQVDGYFKIAIDYLKSTIEKKRNPIIGIAIGDNRRPYITHIRCHSGHLLPPIEYPSLVHTSLKQRCEQEGIVFSSVFSHHEMKVLYFGVRDLHPTESLYEIPKFTGLVRKITDEPLKKVDVFGYIQEELLYSKEIFKSGEDFITEMAKEIMSIKDLEERKMKMSSMMTAVYRNGIENPISEFKIQRNELSHSQYLYSTNEARIRNFYNELVESFITISHNEQKIHRLTKYKK